MHYRKTIGNLYVPQQLYNKYQIIDIVLVVSTLCIQGFSID
jgi:hypothetical protein